jgi:hypothetical protein
MQIPCLPALFGHWDNELAVLGVSGYGPVAAAPQACLW